MAGIGKHTDHNIIMGDSTSKHCIVIVKIVFKELIVYHRSALRRLNISYTTHARDDLNRSIPRGSSLQSTLSAPKQNFNQEWNHAQFIVTDVSMIL